MVTVETKSKSDYIELDSRDEIAVYIFVKDHQRFEEELDNIPKTKELLPDRPELTTMMLETISAEIKIKLFGRNPAFLLEMPEHLMERGREIVKEAWDLDYEIAVFQLYVDGQCEAEST